MLLTVMDKINEHFLKSLEVRDYKIVADGIEGTFKETYLVGMYVMIKHSFLNDGLYKILTVSDTKLTLSATLQAEETNDSVYLYACAIPSEFIDLAADIANYSTGSLGGIKSKSVQDMQVVYQDGSSWYDVFKSNLSLYRKVYSDIDGFRNGIYNWQKIDNSVY